MVPDLFLQEVVVESWTSQAVVLGVDRDELSRHLE
jgi:hypothetical protein